VRVCGLLRRDAGAEHPDAAEGQGHDGALSRDVGGSQRGPQTRLQEMALNEGEREDARRRAAEDLIASCWSGGGRGDGG
jgi:hypothetical protein